MADPPSLAGGVHVRVTTLLPGLADRPVGASGTVTTSKLELVWLSESVPSSAVKVYPVAVSSIVQPENVATPAAVEREQPEIVAPDVPVSGVIDSAIVCESPVTTLPPASSMATTGWVERALPPVPSPGWVEKAS